MHGKIVLSLIFDYWWFPKSFAVKTIQANNNNLGKLQSGLERPEKITWYHEKIMEFCFQFSVGNLIRPRLEMEQPCIGK